MLAYLCVNSGRHAELNVWVWPLGRSALAGCFSLLKCLIQLCLPSQLRGLDGRWNKGAKYYSYMIFTLKLKGSEQENPRDVFYDKSNVSFHGFCQAYTSHIWALCRPCWYNCICRWWKETNFPAENITNRCWIHSRLQYIEPLQFLPKRTWNCWDYTLWCWRKHSTNTYFPQLWNLLF